MRSLVCFCPRVQPVPLTSNPELFVLAVPQSDILVENKEEEKKLQQKNKQTKTEKPLKNPNNKQTNLTFSSHPSPLEGQMSGLPLWF